ncbi:Calponin-1 [Tritrichomonas foetus]|uniref:Calponin-1 n=1 Tax=Tritrichomonas foetus TaxID=1144522 RepID=A0A1J4JD34_9EUKA|nr:Calponin-1 [Tritrichomonas foetus]|eukprot:OHS97082.1 Calponin-1 [Tritrichomonas foetus]
MSSQKPGYDKELESRCREWVEGVLGRKLEGATFRDAVLDGSALCDLINVLSPGKIPKVHKSKILMFRRENFGFFQRASVDLGVLQNETAVFEDVNDDKNMPQLLTNIISLARNTQFKPGFKGPQLKDAIKQTEGAKVNFTAEQLAKGNSGPTFLEQATAIAGAAKEESRFVEHGIISNIDEHKYHGQKNDL